MALTQLKTAAIADDAVTTDKLAKRYKYRKNS